MTLWGKKPRYAYRITYFTYNNFILTENNIKPATKIQHASVRLPVLRKPISWTHTMQTTSRILRCNFSYALIQYMVNISYIYITYIFLVWFSDLFKHSIQSRYILLRDLFSALGAKWWLQASLLTLETSYGLDECNFLFLKLLLPLAIVSPSI